MFLCLAALKGLKVCDNCKDLKVLMQRRNEGGLYSFIFIKQYINSGYNKCSFNISHKQMLCVESGQDASVAVAWMSAENNILFPCSLTNSFWNLHSCYSTALLIITYSKYSNLHIQSLVFLPRFKLFKNYNLYNDAE